MADPCLGCGTTVDAATQQLTIKGANSKVWSTDYGDSATASGLYCDPNTGNLWTPPAAKYGTVGVPDPSSWPGATTGGAYTQYQTILTVASGNFPVNAALVQTVATSGFASLVNTTTEPLVAKVRGGSYLVVANIGASDMLAGVRFYVRYYTVAGGGYTEQARDILIATNAGNRVTNWLEREIGTWTIPEGGGITVYYQPWYKALGITTAGGGGIVNLAGWQEPFGNITYNTARPV